MNMRKIYREVARKNGVTVAEVKRDMQEAINIAWESPRDDGGIVASYQRQVPCRGKVPTTDELIRYLAAKAKKESLNFDLK